MYEEGPLREEVFEAKAEFNNLKKLMEDEGYDTKEIEVALKEEKAR